MILTVRVGRKLFLGYKTSTQLKMCHWGKEKIIWKKLQKIIDHLAACQIPQLFCLSFDWDVSCTQTGVNFARNSVKKVSNWLNERPRIRVLILLLMKLGPRGQYFWGICFLRSMDSYRTLRIEERTCRTYWTLYQVCWNAWPDRLV